MRGAGPGWRPRVLVVLGSALGVVLSVLGAAGGEREAPDLFRIARPGTILHFPRDHGAHPDFRTEWWYYTGHLEVVNGARDRFGFQLTFFRSGVARPDPPRPSAWALRDVYFAHLAVSDLGGHRFHMAERMSRDALALAGADSAASAGIATDADTAISATATYKVWIDDWHATLAADGSHHLVAAEPGSHGIELRLVPRKPPAPHGESGLSLKGAAEGQAAYYYSITRLAAEGAVLLGDRVRPVRGEAWMDHEFTTGELDTALVGWDWFGLQLDDGSELMLYLLRRADRVADPASSGSLIDRAGGVIHLGVGEFAVEVARRWTSPASGAIYPMEWHIRIPEDDLDIMVESLLDEQELITRGSTGITYWEGAVRVSGSRRGAPVGGRGYVEMTGYAEPFRARM